MLGPSVSTVRLVKPTQAQQPIPRRLDLVGREHHLPAVPAVDLLDGLIDGLGSLTIGDPMHGGQ